MIFDHETHVKISRFRVNTAHRAKFPSGPQSHAKAIMPQLHNLFCKRNVAKVTTNKEKTRKVANC